MKSVDSGAAALLGLSTVSLVQLWQSAGPSLGDVRKASPRDTAMHQRLLDADIMATGLAVMIGGAASYMFRSWLPVLLALGAVFWVSEWHRQVLISSNESVI